MEVHIDRPKTTIISTQYHMIIDTETKIDSKTYGTFQKMYDPDDKDEFLSNKDVKSDKSKLTFKRKITSGVPRYLHTVNLTNKESVRGIAKLFGFTYEWKEDTRSRLIDTDKVIVIDYSDKSVAIFTKDPEIRNKLKPYEDSMKYNSRLTGPKMEKQAGYILSKSRRDYGEIIAMLDDGDGAVPEGNSTGVEKTVEDTLSTQHQGNGIDEIDSDFKTGYDRFKIWGDSTWISIKCEEIEDESGVTYKKICEKDLSGGRKYIEIELIPTESD